jgi:membrane-bound lytic murein transglycosylase D
VSRAGAKGLWQFMAPTARRYGLRVDRWVDERLDPEKSTQAAARYLRDLYATFGSWHLAQAAYNAGEAKVARALQRRRTADFWQLARSPLIAQETRDFVAAIQAAVLIGREPARYGFSVTPADPVRYEVVSVPSATSLTRLAALSGVSVADLRALNPALRQAETPPGASYRLRVPEGSEASLVVALTAPRRTPDSGTAARLLEQGVHVVKAQETIGGIARRYGVSVAQIAQWNRLSDPGRIYPGDRLRVAWVGPEDPRGGQGGFR